jgi:hypothetical protein
VAINQSFPCIVWSCRKLINTILISYFCRCEFSLEVANSPAHNYMNIYRHTKLILGAVLLKYWQRPCCRRLVKIKTLSLQPQVHIEFPTKLKNYLMYVIDARNFIWDQTEGHSRILKFLDFCWQSKQKVCTKSSFTQAYICCQKQLF